MISRDLVEATPRCQEDLADNIVAVVRPDTSPHKTGYGSGVTHHKRLESLIGLMCTHLREVSV
jgi:hypothetical protein